MTRIICVNVEPYDYARRVDAQGCGALVKACAGARNIEPSHGTVAGPQEAMINGKAVVEGSRDRLRWGNTGGERPYTAGGIGRCIKCGEAAVGVSHKDTKIAPRRGFPK